MPDLSPRSALAERRFNGYACISEAPARGMITLRADLSSKSLAKAVKDVVNVGIPGPRKIEVKDGRGAGWMSPDELLLLVPPQDVTDAMTVLSAALEGTHHLVADVSDARAALRLTGTSAREVLQKLTPTDLAPGRFEAGELRRSRLAQVPAAFWIEDGGFSIVFFRSVADYAFEVLRLAATPGGEVGLWV